MKKAVISTGGKQYIVSEEQTLEIEQLNEKLKTVNFVPLLLIDEGRVTVGNPLVEGSKVSADILGAVKSQKTVSIRYKAKKRVHKTKGHRQNLSQIKITSIS